MAEDAVQQLCPSKCISQRQVPLGCITVKLPDELVGEGPVIVLLNLGVELLHPANLEEELSEVFVSFLLPYSLLNTVSKPAAAVLSPEVVNGLEVFV